MGRLNEHKKKHVKGKLECQFPGCTKKCDEEKNMKAHKKYCSKNPNKPPPVQCPYCPKSYDRIKSLKETCQGTPCVQVQGVGEGHGLSYSMIKNAYGLAMNEHGLSVFGHVIIYVHSRVCWLRDWMWEC